MKNTLHPIPKTLLIWLLFFAWATPTLHAQYTLTSNDVDIENGIITNCKTSIDDWGTGDIIIPDTLDGQIITGIGDWVFFSQNLTGVLLPESIIYIGYSAFCNNEISKLIIPSNIKFIEYNAFGNNNIEELIIPKSLNTIGTNAFGDNKLLEIVFEENSSIRIIGRLAFQNNFFSTLTFPSNDNEGFVGYIDNKGKHYKVGDMVYGYEFLGVTYYAELPIRTLTSEDVMMVDGEIVESAFYKDIIIPDSIGSEIITAIGANAFKLHYLTSIKFPEYICRIKDEAFLFNDLTSLNLPKSISHIGKSAFAANSIDTITLPNSIITIDDYAFYNNFSKYVDFPNSVISIGNEAFKYNGFKEVVLPNSVLNIGEGAFDIPNREGLSNDEFITTISLPHPVINEGFVFTNWKNGKGTTVTEMTDLETSYTAQFTPTQSYQVSGTIVTDETAGLLLLLSGDFDGVRAVSDSGTFQFPLNAGRNITVTPNREGYLFFPESITLNNIQADRTDLYFTSSINDYDVTFVAGENGTISGETSQNRAYKQKTSPVTAIPSSGFKFSSWKDQKGAVLSTDNPVVLEVRSDMDVRAVFELAVGFKANSVVNLQCYPNPVSNKLTIVAPQNIQKVELYNTLGESVFTQDNINKNTITLNAAQYIKGVCFVHVTGKGFTEVVKVVVE